RSRWRVAATPSAGPRPRPVPAAPEARPRPLGRNRPVPLTGPGAPGLKVLKVLLPRVDDARPFHLTLRLPLSIRLVGLDRLEEGLGERVGLHHDESPSPVLLQEAAVLEEVLVLREEVVLEPVLVLKGHASLDGIIPVLHKTLVADLVRQDEAPHLL